MIRTPDHFTGKRIDRYPDVLGADDVGISDSGNGRPDLLDEGLWMIDSYRAMQATDSSVPSGIEYAEHPRQREPSHLNSLPIYRLAPSPLANYRHTAAKNRYHIFCCAIGGTCLAPIGTTCKTDCETADPSTGTIANAHFCIYETGFSRATSIRIFG